MKALLTLLSASALISTMAFADTAMNQQQEQVKNQVQNETQNRFKNMGTDELLEKRGNLHNQQEREQLHNELINREQKMTKEQKEKFGRAPEKVSQEMGRQNKGNAYGQGQGMKQGQGKKMGGGKGKGGR